ncbi:hypothetical protein FA95DRAFT_1562084 [Auriscalpium vulgare]|uniref:Uncharacterized protein n=1 Tax=Auriscalpium vulgare TaxID=40419 RepID=A0ACB8RKG3_9AGAM|nr:hypothetical protein FA95DRAFT_1562084 [Auriscalpium vulgare]
MHRYQSTRPFYSYEDRVQLMDMVTNELEALRREHGASGPFDQATSSRFFPSFRGCIHPDAKNELAEAHAAFLYISSYWAACKTAPKREALLTSESEWPANYFASLKRELSWAIERIRELKEPESPVLRALGSDIIAARAYNTALKFCSQITVWIENEYNNPTVGTAGGRPLNLPSRNS